MLLIFLNRYHKIGWFEQFNCYRPLFHNIRSCFHALPEKSKSVILAFCSTNISNRIEFCVECMPTPCNSIRVRFICGLMRPVLSSSRVVVTQRQKEARVLIQRGTRLNQLSKELWLQCFALDLHWYVGSFRLTPWKTLSMVQTMGFSTISKNNNDVLNVFSRMYT